MLTPRATHLACVPPASFCPPIHVLHLRAPNPSPHPVCPTRTRHQPPTSSAFLHARLLVALTHSASLGHDQFSLGTTRPPSSDIAASTALLKAGKRCAQSTCPRPSSLSCALLLLPSPSSPALAFRAFGVPFVADAVGCGSPDRTPSRAPLRAPLGLPGRGGRSGGPQSSRRYSPSTMSPPSSGSMAGTCGHTGHGVCLSPRSQARVCNGQSGAQVVTGARVGVDRITGSLYKSGRKASRSHSRR